MKRLKIIKKTQVFFEKNRLEIAFIFFAFCFSWWLMWHTFSYKDGTIYIAAKAWSDFAANIPLIRSFSWGKNFPPEYPIFSGEPIRYHFLFYAFVGVLEKIGFPIDWALNLPSLFSFALLLLIIFYLSRFLFKNNLVSFLSAILFLFNSSFSFLYFFQKHNPFSAKIFFDILSNETFPAFAPYDKSLISGGFWNLNVFTNQRHLALPLSILLILVFFTLKSIKKQNFSLTKALTTGLIIGFFPFLHSAVFIMSIAVFGGIFLLFKQRKKTAIILLVALTLSLPQILYLKGNSLSPGVQLKPGYLVWQNLTPFTFIRYWLLNLGLSFLLIPTGFLLSNRFVKKVFLVFSPVFLIGNLFQFGPDMAANHKFFNLWIIIANMFTAYSLSPLWQKRVLGKSLVIILLVLLTLSGVIDFFAIKNDLFYPVLDAPKNPDILWIKNNTTKDAVFLNTSYLYHPASLAGRKIFLGWPYFSWSIGYDTYKRDSERIKILEASHSNKTIACNTLKGANIQFVFLGHNDPETLTPNLSFWENNFVKAYNNPQANSTIYDVRRSCL